MSVRSNDQENVMSRGVTGDIDANNQDHLGVVQSEQIDTTIKRQGESYNKLPPIQLRCSIESNQVMNEQKSYIIEDVTPIINDVQEDSIQRQRIAVFTREDILKALVGKDLFAGEISSLMYFDGSLGGWREIPKDQADSLTQLFSSNQNYRQDRDQTKSLEEQGFTYPWIIDIVLKYKTKNDVSSQNMQDNILPSMIEMTQRVNDLEELIFGIGRQISDFACKRGPNKVFHAQISSPAQRLARNNPEENHSKTDQTNMNNDKVDDYQQSQFDVENYVHQPAINHLNQTEKKSINFGDKSGAMNMKEINGPPSSPIMKSNSGFIQKSYKQTDFDLKHLDTNQKSQSLSLAHHAQSSVNSINIAQM